MPLTHFPNGVSVRAASATNASTGDQDLNCLDLFVDGTVNISGSIVTVGSSSVTGSVTGAVGSVYGGKATITLGSTPTVVLSSALFDSAATNIVPYKCIPEIVYVQGATANITRVIRVIAGSVSTDTVVCTLTVGSATSAANGIYTTIGGTALTQGSFFEVTSAVTATANTGFLMVNFIPVA